MKYSKKTRIVSLYTFIFDKLGRWVRERVADKSDELITGGMSIIGRSEAKTFDSRLLAGEGICRASWSIGNGVSRRISWPSHSRKGRNWCLRGISLWLKCPQGLSTGGTTDIAVPETRPVNPAFKASLCKRRKQKIYFPQLFDLFASLSLSEPELPPYAYRNSIFFLETIF